MSGNMFDGLFTAMRVGAVILVISVPLGIWKLIEIVLWLTSHITIT